MKQIIFIIQIICLFSLINAYAETITYKGLVITVVFEESDLNDILEFVVRAKNTTDQEKTLLGTIYLNAENYPGLSTEEMSTPVYLELPASETAEDTFYLISSIEITSPEWYFEVDEVYDFIVDLDFEQDDDVDGNYPDSEEDEEQEMENDTFIISGYWKMEKNENSKIYGNWSWLFKDDGTLIIEEILTVEARLPMNHEGSYEIKGNTVIITLFTGSPFPGSFTIQGDKLIAQDVILIKTFDT